MPLDFIETLRGRFWTHPVLFFVCVPGTPFGLCGEGTGGTERGGISGGLERRGLRHVGTHTHTSHTHRVNAKLQLSAAVVVTSLSLVVGDFQMRGAKFRVGHGKISGRSMRMCPMMGDMVKGSLRLDHPKK